MRLALELAASDYASFVRRLPIIIIEDAALHPGLPLVTWLMLAQGAGYTPPPRVVEACLAVVGEVASTTRQDLEARAKLRDEARAPGRDALNAVPEGHPRALLVRCLLVRSEYGGMRGDCLMMKGAARVWDERFAAPSEADRPAEQRPLDLPFEPLFYLDPGTLREWRTVGGRGVDMLFAEFPARSSSTPPDSSLEEAREAVHAHLEGGLRSSDLPLAGIDFHCKPQIIAEILMFEHANASLLRDVVANEGLGRLKSAMWQCLSSVNTRRALTSGSGSADVAGEEATRRVWELMAPAHRAIATRVVRKSVAMG